MYTVKHVKTNRTIITVNDYELAQKIMNVFKEKESYILIKESLENGK